MRTVNFLMFKLVLEKAEKPEIKLPTSTGSWKKQKSSRKNIYFCFIDCAKALDCWTNLDSILKSRATSVPTKVRLVSTMVFPVVVYGCESWTIK